MDPGGASSIPLERRWRGEFPALMRAHPSETTIELSKVDTK